MVLSDMLELGADSDAAHDEIAATVASIAPRHIVVIGSEFTKAFAKLAPACDVAIAESPASATDMLTRLVKDDDAIFIKGSKGSGAWRVADAVLAAMSDQTPATSTVTQPAKEKIHVT
jgi:UDP-N-acetylmuramoyl-tripeptide--D-alanyl-D-alanine ligase